MKASRRVFPTLAILWVVRILAFYILRPVTRLVAALAPLPTILITDIVYSSSHDKDTGWWVADLMLLFTVADRIFALESPE